MRKTRLEYDPLLEFDILVDEKTGVEVVRETKDLPPDRIGTVFNWCVFLFIVYVLFRTIMT